MTWEEFYDVYFCLSEETVKECIPLIKDIGPSEELVDAVISFVDSELKVMLVTKALDMRVGFTHEDFMNLEGELPDEVYGRLAKESGFCAECPSLNPKGVSWDMLYEGYPALYDSTIREYVIALREVGASDEVVELVNYLTDDDTKNMLVEKALYLGVKFTHEDFMNLEFELSDELYERIARERGYCVECPEFNPKYFTWEDFYVNCYNLPDKIIEASIPRITEFGPSDEIVEVFLDIDNKKLKGLLIKQAVERGVKFTPEQVEEMGISKRKSGFWEAVAGVVAADSLLSSDDKTHNGSCNGDCANCPSHYGYRYGRWYYGHGHQHGCEFGGNKGT